jgi:hypothetical protein
LSATASNVGDVLEVVVDRPALLPIEQQDLLRKCERPRQVAQLVREVREAVQGAGNPMRMIDRPEHRQCFFVETGRAGQADGVAALVDRVPTVQ